MRDAFDLVGRVEFGLAWTGREAAAIHVGKRAISDEAERARGQAAERVLRRWIENRWVSIVYTDAAGVRISYPDHPSLHLAAIYPAQGESGQIELVSGDIYEALADVAGMPAIANVSGQNPGPRRGFQKFREAVAEVLREHGHNLASRRVREILQTKKLPDEEWPQKSQQNVILLELRDREKAATNAGRSPVGRL